MITKDYDPGPLDDAKLRDALAGRPDRWFPASKTSDRVQDAFDRLIRERDAARASLDAALAMLDEGTELAEDLINTAARERFDALRAQIYTGFGAFMFGVATVLVAHAVGWV